MVGKTSFFALYSSPPHLDVRFFAFCIFVASKRVSGRKRLLIKLDVARNSSIHSFALRRF